MHEALSDESGDRALAVGVEHGVDNYVRAAPLWRSLDAAAISDTADRATDLVFVLFSHETFLALTRDAAWTIEDYKAWLYSTLRGQLAGATDTGRDALRSLSYETHLS